nr:MAG TPA: hypothetical protein [Caudoviricetes sp.]
MALASSVFWYMVFMVLLLFVWECAHYSENL